MDTVIPHGQRLPDSSGVEPLIADCVLGLDHVAIAVQDIKESRDWYVRNLGFRCVAERETRGESTGMISAVLVAGSSVVVLIQGTERTSQVSRFIQKKGPGVQHMAFAVKDLDEAMRRLINAGASADTPIIEAEGIRQVFLRRDVSGVRVELIERRGGDFSDRTVEELFRRFEEGELY
jgi:methylmalonyl-CoA epimerase